MRTRPALFCLAPGNTAITESFRLVQHLLQVDLKLGVSKATRWSLGTKTAQIIRTRYFLHVLVTTPRSMFAETTGIERTLHTSGVGNNVAVHALVVGALAVATEKETLWHLVKLKTVNKLALYTFFA